MLRYPNSEEGITVLHAHLTELQSSSFADRFGDLASFLWAKRFFHDSTSCTVVEMTGYHCRNQSRKKKVDLALLHCLWSQVCCTAVAALRVYENISMERLRHKPSKKAVMRAEKERTRLEVGGWSPSPLLLWAVVGPSVRELPSEYHPKEELMTLG